MIAIVAAVLFVIGAIAETTDDHTALGQPGMFWLLLGLAAWALHHAYPTAAPRSRRQ
jgi:hypothetical protein